MRVFHVLNIASRVAAAIKRLGNATKLSEVAPFSKKKSKKNTLHCREREGGESMKHGFRTRCELLNGWPYLGKAIRFVSRYSSRLFWISSRSLLACFCRGRRGAVGGAGE